MATGITWPIKDGSDINFNSFVWRCARLMGPLIEMRDEPLDKPPPYELKLDLTSIDASIEQTKSDIAELESMDETKLMQKALHEYQESLGSYIEYENKKARIFERYENMLLQVRRWNPPSKNHDPLKNLMIEQLQDSMEHDCHPSNPPNQPNFLTWKTDRLNSLKKSLAHDEERRAEEIHRTDRCNSWLKLLRDSVPYPNKL